MAQVTGFIDHEPQTITFDSLNVFHAKHFPELKVPGVEGQDSSIKLDDNNIDGEAQDLGFYQDGTKRYLTDQQVEYLQFREIKAALEGQSLDDLLGESGVKRSANSQSCAYALTGLRKSKSKSKSKKGKWKKSKHHHNMEDAQNDSEPTPNRVARELDEADTNNTILDY